MKRLFIAIPIACYIKEAIKNLRIETQGIRWIPEQSMHLTLKFIGDTDARTEDLIKRSLDTIRVRPFLLPVEGLGYFPTRGQPSVIWVGVGSGHPHLFQLKKKIEDALFNIGIEPDSRVYHPHITIARCKEATPEMVYQLAKRYKTFATALFKVETFQLLSSQLLDETVYLEEASWKLG